MATKSLRAFLHFLRFSSQVGFRSALLAGSRSDDVSRQKNDASRGDLSLRVRNGRRFEVPDATRTSHSRKCSPPPPTPPPSRSSAPA